MGKFKLVTFSGIGMDGCGNYAEVKKPDFLFDNFWHRLKHLLN